MPMEKKLVRRPTGHQARARKRKRSALSNQDIAVNRRLGELAEVVDIMVPELTARVAAVEQLLVEKQVCTHDDLIRSREFIDSRPSEQ